MPKAMTLKISQTTPYKNRTEEFEMRDCKVRGYIERTTDGIRGLCQELAFIRDKGLHKEGGFERFEKYVKDRILPLAIYSQPYLVQLADAGSVVNAIHKYGKDDVVQPRSERQLRGLTPLLKNKSAADCKKVAVVWEAAAAAAEEDGKKEPSGRLVKEIAQERYPDVYKKSTTSKPQTSTPLTKCKALWKEMTEAQREKFIAFIEEYV